jgi:hypothetical protein
LTHYAAIGTTGSGKSVHINSILISIFFNQKYFDSIRLVDLKGGMEFSRYSGMMGNKVTVGTSIEDFMDNIELLYNEMVDRENEAKQNGYNFSTRKPIFFLVDEFGQWQTTLDGSGAGDYELRQRYRKIEEYLNKLMTKARALKIYIWLISQKGTTDHFPSTIREMCISKSVLKTNGFYDVFLSEETFQKVGLNPDFFSIGTFLFNDGTESFGKTGDHIVFLKAPLVKQYDILTVLPDYDREILESKMIGQVMLLEALDLVNNNKSTMEEHKNLSEYFRGTNMDMKYVNPTIVNQFLKQNNLSESHYLEEREDPWELEKDFTLQVQKHMRDEFIPYCNQVKHLMAPEIQDGIDDFIKGEFFDPQKRLSKKDYYEMLQVFEDFKVQYPLPDNDESSVQINPSNLEKVQCSESDFDFN